MPWVLTDPTTGMTYGYLLFTDTRANKIIVTLECLYGFAPASSLEAAPALEPAVAASASRSPTPTGLTSDSIA